MLHYLPILSHLWVKCDLFWNVDVPRNLLPREAIRPSDHDTWDFAPPRPIQYGISVDTEAGCDYIRPDQCGPIRFGSAHAPIGL